jgi:hypothetical protein
MSEAFAGIPRNMLPTYQFWDAPGCPVRSLRDMGSVDISELGKFDGKALWLGIGGRNTAYIAAQLHLLSRLECLVIDGRVIPPRVIDAVARLHGLKRLELMNVSTSPVSPLAQLTCLQYLMLSGVSKATNFSFLSKLQELVSLGLGVRSDSYPSILRSMPSGIECLLLAGPGERVLKATSFDGLKTLPALRYMVLLNCKSDDKSLDFCLEMPKLKAVTVARKTWWSCESIDRLTDNGIVVSSII